MGAGAKKWKVERVENEFWPNGQREMFKRIENDNDDQDEINDGDDDDDSSRRKSTMNIRLGENYADNCSSQKQSFGGGRAEWYGLKIFTDSPAAWRIYCGLKMEEDDVRSDIQFFSFFVNKLWSNLFYIMFWGFMVSVILLGDILHCPRCLGDDFTSLFRVYFKFGNVSLFLICPQDIEGYVGRMFR